MNKWIPTDLLRVKKGTLLRVKRLNPLGVGNQDLGTEQGVVYWNVEPSPRYAQETGVHMISMVPETRLRPLVEEEIVRLQKST